MLQKQITWVFCQLQATFARFVYSRAGSVGAVYYTSRGTPALQVGAFLIYALRRLADSSASICVVALFRQRNFVASLSKNTRRGPDPLPASGRRKVTPA